MSQRSVPWLEPSPPWFEPVPSSLHSSLGLSTADVPVVELLNAPCSLSDVVAIRSGRFIPLFGKGATRDEALRLLALLSRALGPSADPRGPDYALSMTLHPVLGVQTLEYLVSSLSSGNSEPLWVEAILAYAAVLGAGDALREQLAREVAEVRGLGAEPALAIGAGGGDYGTYREHYGSLSAGPGHSVAPVRAVRAWFDWVLARRFAGLDALRTFSKDERLDHASLWLLACGDFIAGEELARSRMTELAEEALGPTRALVPRLMSLVAKEMAELVHRPMLLRMMHLRSAAARDHAAVAIRAWLAAATEPDAEDPTEALLGPEPTRAGRAAIEARQAGSEFLLDWFVADRDAREALDNFAQTALRVYHRLRGAQMLARVERGLRPTTGTLSPLERIVWPQGVGG